MGEDVLAQLGQLGLVAVACVLGGIAGVERQRSNKPAGLRTHMLIAGASCLVVLLGRDALGAGATGDATRPLHAVITGIGFIGAGTILHDKKRGAVSGLTTAASLFFAATIGIGVGFGKLVLTAGCALLLLTTLAVMRRLGPWIDRVLSTEAVEADPAEDAIADLDAAPDGEPEEPAAPGVARSGAPADAPADARPAAVVSGPARRLPRPAADAAGRTAAGRAPTARRR